MLEELKGLSYAEYRQALQQLIEARFAKKKFRSYFDPMTAIDTIGKPSIVLAIDSEQIILECEERLYVIAIDQCENACTLSDGDCPSIDDLPTGTIGRWFGEDVEAELERLAYFDPERETGIED
jgi:hypothetical protein